MLHHSRHCAELYRPGARSGAPAPAGTAGRASGEEPVVNLYFWSDYLAPDTLSAFEKKTGIKVHLSYFDSYETLEAKLSTGNSEFDVVLPGTGTGSMVGFDLLAIHRDAPHPKNAHELIDYLLEARVAAEITNFIGYANANRDSTPLLAADIAADTAIYPTPAERERLVPEREVTPEQSRAITRIWQRFKTGQ